MENQTNNSVDTSSGEIITIEEAYQRFTQINEMIRDSLLLTIDLCFYKSDVTDPKTGESITTYRINPSINRLDVEEAIERHNKHADMLMHIALSVQYMDIEKLNVSREVYDEYVANVTSECKETLGTIDYVLNRLNHCTFYDDYDSYKAALREIATQDKPIWSSYVIHVHLGDEAFESKLTELATLAKTQSIESPALNIPPVLSGGMGFDVRVADGEADIADGVLNLVEFVDREYKSYPLPDGFRSIIKLDEEDELTPVFFDEPKQVTRFLYSGDNTVHNGIIVHYDKVIHGKHCSPIKLKLADLSTDELLALTERDMDGFKDAAMTLVTMMNGVQYAIQHGGHTDNKMALN